MLGVVMKGEENNKVAISHHASCIGKRNMGSVPVFTVFMLIFLLSIFSVKAYATEAVTNGTFSGSTSWTLTVTVNGSGSATCTYDDTNTHTADGTGSVKLHEQGRNKASTCEVTQTFGSAIPSGSTINAASIYEKLATNYETTGDSVLIDLVYADNTTVNIVNSGELTNNANWSNFTGGGTQTLPFTISQNVTGIKITMNTKSGNNANATADLWIDEVSVTYTTTPPPSVVSGPTASSTQYGTFVDSPFSINSVFNDNGSAITSCDYSLNNGGSWTAGTVSGSGASTNCDTTTATCTDGAALTILMRATNAGGTTNTGTISRTCDAAAPAAVADLAGPTSTATSVDLTWTNPSDGTGSGNASFDVRYRIGSTFVEADWASASQATGEPTPPTTGMTVSGLTCGTTYTFAIKTTDNVGNISTISNAATKATAACPPSVVSGPTALNTQYGTYVDSPFDLQTEFNGNGSSTTCEYCKSTDGTCDTEWASASGSGTGVFTCSQSGLTGTNGQTLTLNMRATNAGGTTTATAITRTVDSVTPTTTASATGYTFGTWTATSPISVTLSASDGGSGVASGYPKYCIDSNNTCSPTTTYTAAFDVTCGTTCTQYVRYYSVDNVSNTETVNSSQVKQDLQSPTAPSTFSATDAGSGGQCNLSWSADASDGGSGLNTTAAFKSYWATGSAPACGGGTLGCTQGSSSTSCSVTGLTNNTLHYFRLCIYDNVNNQTSGGTATCTPTAGVNTPPTLSYPSEAGYTDGKGPDTGNPSTTFRFKVVYTDTQGDAPQYVRLCLGDNDGYFCYNMTVDTNAAATLQDSNYTNGEQYVYGPIGLGSAQDIRFYFEAQAATGDPTVVILPSDAPTSYDTGPSVYLLYGPNMVGVPKDLSAGYTFNQVLYDDSGYSYCYRWNSSGTLDQGTYESCRSSNISAGYGYWIWGRYSNYFRLDEPSGVGNVTTSPFDITLDPQGGYNMISNPYNKRIPLCSDISCTNSGARVNVVRISDGLEKTFSDAVSSNWIGNSIYEWEGEVSGYVGRAYNDPTPVVLEPWTGYWIRIPTADAFKLRVYKE